MKAHYLIASKDTPSSAELFRRIEGWCGTLTEPEREVAWVKTPDELQEALKGIDPDYLIHIFFFHWSWIVPADIYELYSCVVIHTANLPHGRGGSPIQNQMKDGVWQINVNALKMIGKLDAGAVYCKEPITLGGNIDEIWWTIMMAAEKIIHKMVQNPYMTPRPQISPDDKEAVEPPPYKRRKPEQSVLPKTGGLVELHDHIRMLDGVGYPPAFIEHGDFRLEFSRSKPEFGNKGSVLADVRITKKTKYQVNKIPKST